MQKEQLEGQFQQLRAQIKQKWNKLTDNDLNSCNCKHDALCNCIQKAYGCKKEQAEQQIRDFKPELASSSKGDSRQNQGQGQQRPGQPQGQPQRQGQPGQSQPQREKGPEQREKARL